MLRRHDIVQAYNLGISRKRENQHVAEQVRLNNLTGAHVFEVTVQENSLAIRKKIQDIQWPHDSIVASIRRNGRLIVPHGDTELKAGDRLIIVAALELEVNLAALINEP
jgi:chloride channel protein, CIC family